MTTALERLSMARVLRVALRERENALAAEARAEGATWQSIADACGMKSRQHALRVYNRRGA